MNNPLEPKKRCKKDTTLCKYCWANHSGNT